MTKQEQLANLLNSVPDNVLICTKGNEHHQLQPIYANARINQFFGKSVVNQSRVQTNSKKKLKKVKNPYEKKNSSKDRTVKEQTPLKRRIFRDTEVYRDKDADQFLDIMQQDSEVGSSRNDSITERSQQYEEVSLINIID